MKKLLDETKQHDLIADINAKGLDNWTALHFAVNEGRTEIVKELLSRDGVEKDPVSNIMRTPLHLACMRGNTAIVRMLVTSGANINSQDDDGNTPLHFASEFGHFESIIFLVKEAGSDPQIQNKYDYSPSDIA